ncbi:hypothetical protein DSO57_1034205 [Entomophthora muscae]|uniref:Uncharacterized protein n=1 Tax=Entomophthora muscae TaxID=34485 RepID=A0ACC2S1T5_9FUNG|nr:hypothetical protein DSO57_1034205 [Entomophthora muscae]
MDFLENSATLLNLRYFNQASSHATVEPFPYDHIVTTISEHGNVSVYLSCGKYVLYVHEIFGHIHDPTYLSAVLLLLAEDEGQHYVVRVQGSLVTHDVVPGFSQCLNHC